MTAKRTNKLATMRSFLRLPMRERRCILRRQADRFLKTEAKLPPNERTYRQ
jgi:hypothetical protein